MRIPVEYSIGMRNVGVEKDPLVAGVGGQAQSIFVDRAEGVRMLAPYQTDFVQNLLFLRPQKDRPERRSKERHKSGLRAVQTGRPLRAD